MDTFAFIIHPIDPKRDVSRKFPLLGRVLNERQIDFFSTFFPPVYISEINGVASQASGRSSGADSMSATRVVPVRTNIPAPLNQEWAKSA